MESPIGLIKELIRTPESSENIYNYPFSKETKVSRTVTVNESHTGPFKGAIDFVVPLGTPVLAPLDGEVVAVVDSHDKFGPDKSFKDFLNYVTISHANGEFSQPAHLAKGSASVRVGDHVSAGQQIGITGNSGWMTEPHLHLFVFKLVEKNPPGFVGLKPIFKKV